MTKYVCLMMSLIITAELSAKTYFSKKDQTAIIYIMDGTDGINALLCEDVSKVEARNIMKSEIKKPESFDQGKCSKMLSSPITKATLEKNVPEIKKKHIQKLRSFPTIMGNLTRTFSEDEAAGNEVEDLFKKLSKEQIVQVESINAEWLFSQLLLEVKKPFIELVNLEEIEEKFEALIDLE